MTDAPPTPRPRGWLDLRALALLLCVLATWGNAFRSEYQQRASFFDDSFIYLHVARNVLETGTARTYPITDNEGLIASSPLRLSLLIPSLAAARVAHGMEPSRQAASLAFFLSGVLTCLLFLPFFRGAWTQWLLAAALCGGLAQVTVGTLQMEGALVFWCLFTLVRALARKASPLQVGTLLVLCTATRLEYGVSAWIATSCVYAFAGRGVWRALPRWLALHAIALALWWIVASCLGVWPIPTTFLTNVQTGVLGLFGKSFAGSMIWTLRYYLPLPEDEAVATTLVGLGAAGCGLLAWRCGIAGRGLLLLLVCEFLLLAGGPGNYVWYHENMLTGLFGGLLALALYAGPPTAATHRVPALVLISACALLATRRFGANDDRAWNLQDARSHGAGYVALAKRHRGDGLFHFAHGRTPDLGPAYVSITEIGIISYFAGADCWLYDTGGLAQAGELPGVHRRWLAAFYPRRLLVTSQEEFAKVRTPTAPEAPLCAATWYPPDDAPAADFVLAEVPILLRRLPTRVK